VKFVNNTVAKNTSDATGISGINCSASFTLTNAIVWGNGMGPAYQGCAFTYSTVQGASAPAGTGNLNVDPGLNATYQPTAAGVFGKGDTTAAAITSIDRAGAARVKSGAVDLGAYEVN
jgi:hypothetical protein